MTLQAGQAVKREDKHGVIKEVRGEYATVAWHVKQAKGTASAGMSEGGLREPLDGLVPDSLCPHCKEFLAPVK
jgi:hypothetical protein